MEFDVPTLAWNKLTGYDVILAKDDSIKIGYLSSNRHDNHRILIRDIPCNRLQRKGSRSERSRNHLRKPTVWFLKIIVIILIMLHLSLLG